MFSRTLSVRARASEMNRHRASTLARSAITLAWYALLVSPAVAQHDLEAAGWNAYGQLGDGTTVDRNTLVSVGGLVNVSAIGAGEGHSLALTADGRVWAWGSNSVGQLGLGEPDGLPHPRPVPVPGLPPAVGIAAGGNQSFAVDPDGTLYAWGGNNVGQLGDGTTTDRPAPILVEGIADVKMLATATTQTIALKQDGTVWAWGYNENGNLGDGLTADRHVPGRVIVVLDIVQVASYFQHSAALKADGTVWTWGLNHYGQLGYGTNEYGAHPTPQQVTRLPQAVQRIAAGAGGPAPNNNPGGHCLAVAADGTVYAWGDNLNGQLGDGTTTMRNSPILVPGLSDVHDVAAGYGHSLAILGDETALAWGKNANGQLGDGTNIERHNAVPISGAQHVNMLAAGALHTLVMGGVACDAIGRFKVKCNLGKLSASVKSSLPEGTELTLDNNGDRRKVVTVNARGKAKAKWTSQVGVHTVSVVECPEQSRQADCG